MRITEVYNDANNDVIEIISAQNTGNNSIKIVFNDKTEKIVNFRPFLERSLHPSITKYLNETTFNEFKIVNGNLNWNDYDMIFPVEDLYEGRV